MIKTSSVVVVRGINSLLRKDLTYNSGYRDVGFVKLLDQQLVVECISAGTSECISCVVQMNLGYVNDGSRLRYG